MTMMLPTVNPSTPAQPAQQANAPAAAKDTPAAGAPAAGSPAAASRAGAAATGTAPVPAQSFARWLGQQPDAAAQALAAAQTAGPGAADGDPAAAAAPAAGSPDRTDGKSTDDTKATATPDGTLLAAMAMPLMPLSPQQVTQAVQAAQGGARAGSEDRSGDASAQPLAGQDGRRAAQPQATLVQAQPAAQPDATAANVRLAVPGNATGGNNTGADAQDANPDHAPAQAGTNAAAMAVPGAVGAQPAQPSADTVKLAGPPTAWRQTLQDTLGDRLNVHVAGNVQQATISIEPPQLGRIDIAIRHSAGTLEVNISATNGDVLRQLQTVSDNLRNDLAQRQYTEVAVTVTPTPKNNAAPFGDPQQQGRGRQQGRDQDNEPGRGLAEAGNPASVFNLGRDS
jgi:flagellar hook-length control protein FliK